MEEISKINLKKLKEKKYPGRGIIIGLTPDKKNYVQIYWIMGRSKNSRNIIFVEENGYLKNEIYDEKLVKDTSLILYYSMKNFKDKHIISNGDQTETIFKYIKNGKNFEKALGTRYFEPDGPNFTPRISGILFNEKNEFTYKLSLIKSIDNNKNYCAKYFFNYESAIPGYGHFISTYIDDGNPLPSYNGEPKILPIFNNMTDNLKKYWDLLNKDNRISIAVKYINIENKSFSYKIINKNLM